MKTRILAGLLALMASTLFSYVQAQDINLTGYTKTFDDEFNTLSATTSSPKGASNWYAGPANGSTGDFSESTWTISAFTASNNLLTDEAYYSGGGWYSGILESVDPTTAGFSQEYGYFEIRCQMPNAGEGAWPAFWLDSTSGISGGQNEEIDIFEWYGVTNTPGSDSDAIQEASHNWNSNGTQNDSNSYLYDPSTSMPDGEYPWQGYHIYGCQVDPAHITWYIDGVQTNQIATPTSYVTNPFFVIVDYALGGGWSLSGTPFTTDGTSSLLVNWVRVYSLPTFPVINSASTAIGTEGSSFSYQITAINSPTSYSATGLPAGLSVNTSTGAISGTPTVSGTFSVTLGATNANGTGNATLTLTVSSGLGIGIQFQGSGTALPSTSSAGLPSVAQVHWNVLTGATFSSDALSNSSGSGTTTTLSGTAAGTYGGGGLTAPPAGNADLTSGELWNGTTPGSNALTVSNIPYASYSVYVYDSMDAAGRNETVSLTPSGGSAQYYSFATESGGSAWTAATSTWNGTGTAPTLPSANYVVYTGLTASSFTMTWFAPGNGSINAIQIVPTATPAPVITSSTSASGTVGSAFSYTITATNSPTSYNATGLPAGLSVNTSTGVISGTPTASGTSSVTISASNAGGTGSATLSLTVNASGGSQVSIGMQFQGDGTALPSSSSAGLSSVAQTDWNVLTGASFSNHALSNNSGSSTTATLSGTAMTSYFAGGSSAPPAGNSDLASGEVVNGTTAGTNSLTVSNIPYASYNVYVYAAIDATGRNETVSLTPSGGSAQYYSFTTEGGGSAWTAATSTWNGTGTAPSLPSANYVEYTGLTASSFSLTWFAPGNGAINGIQIVATSGPPAPVITSSTSASGTMGSAFSYTITASNSPTSYNATGLPAGLSVNTSTGVISGTPTTSGTSSVTISATNSGGTGSATLTLTVNASGGSGTSIGVQFQGGGTALPSTSSAGLSNVAQTNWTVLTGASFTNKALSYSTGTNSPAILSGSAVGTYWAGGSSASPSGNADMASGELYNGTTSGTNSITVTNIPYASYSVYIYAGIDATGRNETVSLTPSGGSAQYYSFTTEGGGSAWTAATSTWNGTGTAPSLPSANYVVFTGLSASSFTMTWFAPGNGAVNGFQIVPTP